MPDVQSVRMVMAEDSRVPTPTPLHNPHANVEVMGRGRGGGQCVGTHISQAAKHMELIMEGSRSGASGCNFWQQYRHGHVSMQALSWPC